MILNCQWCDRPLRHGQAGYCGASCADVHQRQRIDGEPRSKRRRRAANSRQAQARIEQR